MLPHIVSVPVGTKLDSSKPVISNWCQPTTVNRQWKSTHFEGAMSMVSRPDCHNNDYVPIRLAMIVCLYVLYMTCYIVLCVSVPLCLCAYCDYVTFLYDCDCVPIRLMMPNNDGLMLLIVSVSLIDLCACVARNVHIDLMMISVSTDDALCCHNVSLCAMLAYVSLQKSPNVAYVSLCCPMLPLLPMLPTILPEPLCCTSVSLCCFNVSTVLASYCCLTSGLMMIASMLFVLCYVRQ
jgi:hypothetical protein